MLEIQKKLNLTTRLISILVKNTRKVKLMKSVTQLSFGRVQNLPVGNVGRRPRSLQPQRFRQQFSQVLRPFGHATRLILTTDLGQNQQDHFDRIV
jgi:hypothetical protein